MIIFFKPLETRAMPVKPSRTRFCLHCEMHMQIIIDPGALDILSVDMESTKSFRIGVKPTKDYSTAFEYLFKLGISLVFI